MSLPCIFFGLHHQPCPFIQMLVWRNVTKATEGIYSVSVFNENTETKTQTLAFKIKGMITFLWFDCFITSASKNIK